MEKFIVTTGKTIDLAVTAALQQLGMDRDSKAIRLGMLALIRPVMTSTLGRWVATIRWMPAARAFCAMRQI